MEEKFETTRNKHPESGINIASKKIPDAMRTVNQDQYKFCSKIKFVILFFKSEKSGTYIN